MSTRKKKTTRRKTLGQSPLDSLLTTPTSSSRAAPRDKPVAKARPSKRSTQQAAERVAKVRATFHLPGDLVEQCRNAVVWLAGPPERLTMARLAEDALRRELDRLRKKHTNGEPFPQRDDDLRGGRPIGS